MRIVATVLGCLTALLVTVALSFWYSGYLVRIDGSSRPLILGLVVQHQRRMFDWPLKVVFGRRGLFVEVRRPGFDERDALGDVFRLGSL